jgi:hypothetical protein
MRLLQVAQGEAAGRRVSFDADIEVSEHQLLSASELVLRVVTEALERGHISERGARLILLHRLCDVPTSKLAERDGRDVRSVRKYRNRAESALNEVAEVVA